jgi:hypothetical protein
LPGTKDRLRREKQTEVYTLLPCALLAPTEKENMKSRVDLKNLLNIRNKYHYFHHLVKGKKEKRERERERKEGGRKKEEGRRKEKTKKIEVWGKVRKLGKKHFTPTWQLVMHVKVAVHCLRDSKEAVEESTLTSRSLLHRGNFLLQKANFFFFLIIHLLTCAYIVWVISQPSPASSTSPLPP